MNKSKHSLYKTWQMMKNRCLNPNAKDYSYYGGRGIKVCERWLESFDNFLEDLGEKPTKQHSIDRIDVDGNYEPSNVRWADTSTQAANKRTFSNNRIGYKGVREHSKGLFQARIARNNVQKSLGLYDTLEEAISARLHAECIYGT